MILHVPNVLNEQQVAHCRDVIEHATWVDGRVTAGYQSASVKDNRQLPEDSKEAHELGDMIVAALERHPMFISAALPLRVFPRCSTVMMPVCHLDRTWIILSDRSRAHRTVSGLIFQ